MLVHFPREKEKTGRRRGVFSSSGLVEFRLGRGRNPAAEPALFLPHSSLLAFRQTHAKKKEERKELFLSQPRPILSSAAWEGISQEAGEELGIRRRGRSWRSVSQGIRMESQASRQASMRAPLVARSIGQTFRATGRPRLSCSCENISQGGRECLLAF